MLHLASYLISSYQHERDLKTDSGMQLGLTNTTPSKILLEFLLIYLQGSTQTFPAFFTTLRSLILKYSHIVFVAFTSPNCHGLCSSAVSPDVQSSTVKFICCCFCFLARYSILPFFFFLIH